MKKVYRIHTEGDLGQDWFPSTAINENLIKSINADQGDGKKLPTSIPSPFARIDLVRIAFNAVANSGKLDGIERNGVATATDNHKLVSDALDIGQIFFNYDKLGNDLSMVAWDVNTSLNKLINGNDRQKHLGKTLKLFLEQDSLQYNFDKFKKIYILKYKHRIIGGTSPRTLFFASPDAKETTIKFGHDYMLDDALLPLYRRDPEYVKYLYALTKTVNNFDEFFPEINNYILKTIKKLETYNNQLFGELNNLNCEEYLNSLKNISFNNNDGHPLEVITNLSIKQFVQDANIISKNSDFTIATNKEIEKLPLILPIEPFTSRYQYTIGLWDSRTEVPVEDIRPLDQRTLPGQGDKYPYLTMNDFLEDTIVKLPVEIDSNKFFTLNNKGYLLPIKKEFFDYFTIAEIKNGDLIKCKEIAPNNIQIEINIPIKRGFIVYKKIYYPKSDVINEERNPKKGTILEKTFTLSVYPFVKSLDETKINYTIGLADVLPNNVNTSVKFLDSIKGTVLEYDSDNNRIDTRIRSKPPIRTSQTTINENFDGIYIKIGTINNLIIPLWEEKSFNTGDNYEFAIDFGTTNSHIEYKIAKKSEKAFDILENDQQIVFLNARKDLLNARTQVVRDVIEAKSFLEQEIMSEKFGNEELRKSPFRTCLIQNENNFNSDTAKLFTDANIAFDYEKLPISKYLKENTNLKWANNSNEENLARVNLYIEEMLTICKNKVLMNAGNLNNTKIIWFYPVSMTTNHLGNFRSIWEDKFKEVFNVGVSERLFDYPESIAPFYYYMNKQAIITEKRPSVSIDIGGGTCDVLIYANGEPNLISSFKFAGNAIFGDGFNSNINKNGFIRKYYTNIKEKLIKNSLGPENGMIEDLFTNNESSTDLISFLFSLKNNKNLQKIGLDIDFLKLLKRDDDFKLIFLLFYSSIIYHIAEMMKLKNLDMPRNILFSGTGSKTINILDNSNDLSVMNKLFEGIFKKVYNNDDVNISTKINEKPKEITSKGGFYIKNENINHIDLIEINVGKKTDNVILNDSNSNIKKVTYGDIDTAFINEIKNNVLEFYTLFEELRISLNFNNLFGVSNNSITTFNKIKETDLEGYILKGLSILKEETTDEDSLNETLFFYPFIGKLNELATEIMN